MKSALNTVALPHVFSRALWERWAINQFKDRLSALSWYSTLADPLGVFWTLVYFLPWRVAVEVSDCSLYVEQNDSVWFDGCPVSTRRFNLQQLIVCWKPKERMWLRLHAAYRSSWRRAQEGPAHGLDEWDAVWTWRLHYWSARRVLSSLSIQVPGRQHISKMTVINGNG